MANAEHVAVVSAGDSVFRAWRAAHPDTRLDLSKAEQASLLRLPKSLSNASFADCDLDPSWHESELTDCDFSRIRLRNGYFSKVAFRRCTFVGANIAHANFIQCTFIECVLSEAEENQIQLLCDGFRGSNVIAGGQELRMCEVNSSFSNCHFYNCSLVGLLARCALFDQAEFVECNLQDAVLDGSFMDRSTLRMCQLDRARLRKTWLCSAELSGSSFEQADLSGCGLQKADMSPQFVTRTTNNKYEPGIGKVSEDTREVKLYPVCFRGAVLAGADLRMSRLVDVDFTNATLSGALVYGVSAWNNILSGCIQNGLVITNVNEPVMEVDDLEVAHFIYLMIRNERLRSIIEQMTSKVVLLLGRFDEEGRRLLDRLRGALRASGFLPVVFDFQQPSSRGMTETVRLLGGMARFVIADISRPRSAPHELMATISLWDSVPLLPILQKDEKPYAMIEDVVRKRQSLPVASYECLEHAERQLPVWINQLEAKREEIKP